MEGWVGGACALTSAAIWAFSATYLVAPANRYGGRATNLFKSVIGAGCFLVTVLVWLGPGAMAISPDALARFAASGILGLAIADTAYLTALRHVGPSLTAIVYQTSGIFTSTLGIVFLGETLSEVEALGIALVIGGVMLAEPPPAVPRGHRVRGTLLALVAAAFHSVGVVVNKGGFHELAADDGVDGPRAAILAGFVRMTTASVALLVYGAATRSLARQTLPLRQAAGWRAVVLPAFFGTFVAMATMQLALVSLKSGIASVLLSMTPVFTIPVEWWVLKHRPSARSILGALVALAGAFLIAPKS